MSRKALITGGAGFIASNLIEQLLKEDFELTVIDNFDPYYDRSIKERNLANFINNPNVKFIECDIRDWDKMQAELLDSYDTIVHIAAKAGVRPSIKAPRAYQEVNVNGTQNMMELAKICKTKQFVFASSSSVYGVNPNMPWKEDDHVLKPISPYASSKISGELLGHVYSKLNDMRFIALRFFTVYGPRQRPDLAIHKFVKKIQAGEPIPVYGDGSTERDYTFVGDTIKGIRAAMDYDKSMFEIINLGNHQTVSLKEMIETIETVLGKKAIIDRQPEQPGDVPKTYADISKAKELLNYQPNTEFIDGVRSFVEWMQTFQTEKKVVD